MDAGCKKQRLGSWESFPDLSTAACELRAASTVSKLESCAGEEGWKDVEAFYERLKNLQKTCELSSPWYKPIIVSVEGIVESKGRGFGQGLEGECSKSSVRLACAPPASLSVVKGIFDKVGGAVAWAFKVVSNYMAVQECKDVCMAERTLGASCDDLCMAWPPGLLMPSLQLTLVPDAAASSPELANVHKALQSLDVEQISLRVNSLSEQELLDLARGEIDKAGEEVPASMVLLLGSYPFQQQWRGEGLVRKMRWGSPPPPFSLACAMQRCKELCQHELAGPSERRMALFDQEAVLGARSDDTRYGPSTAYIFIPYRMEVLIGHPPAPGGTRRCEWHRSTSRLWEGPRAVLPFSPQHLEQSWERPKVRKATVVIMGAHTAGKSTVRKMVAQRLQWESDEELGTSLRGEQEEKGKYQETWDDMIHQAEVARDQERMQAMTSRVVETWHLGNFTWALTRHPEQQEDFLQRTLDAIRKEQEAGTVLLVLLKINAATMVRRRAKFETSALSFQDEEGAY
ncbi:unnamed protein product [Symbiodinium pilosum]|uniref:Uncharacterized protein n=1 Tax=Symbiodinium pilosum TaxID=2952 RepID=A0A812LG79_SYMPI|nr:unnamed protein product [Symbiodinium pilosum]